MNALDAMEPRLLRAFIAVAEELHFGRAAARLHISQPPLSMQIRRLEESLGVRLFERDRRHVALTEAGRYLLERARHWLSEAQRCCDEAARIARGEAGTLAVGYTPTAAYDVLPPLVRAYRKRAPEVRLELVEMRSALQPDAIRSGRIEVGLACGPVGADGITERVVARERFVAALPSSHPLAKKQRLRLKDLDGQPFVAVRPDIEPAWAEACWKALAKAGVRAQVVQQTDTKLALLGLVAAGLGLSVVSESMQHLARRGVVYRAIFDLRLRVPLVLLAPENVSARAATWLQTLAGTGSSAA